MSETSEKFPTIEEFNSQCADKILELSPKETVAIVGAGLSQPHYPSWLELVDEIRIHCGIGSLDDDSPSDPISLIDQLQAIKDEHNEKYFDYLRRRFEEEPSEVRSAVNLLTQLRFSSYITTNFDKSLAVSASRNRADYEWIYYPESHAIGDINLGNICAIHGICHPELRNQPDSVVLHRSAYEKAYTGEYQPLTRFFYDLFCLHSCIFFGYGLGDPPIKYILRSLRQGNHRAASSKRRILVKSTERFEAASEKIGEETAKEERKSDLRLLDNYGVEVVRYAPLEGHAGLDRVLESVVDSIHPVKAPKQGLWADENIFDPTSQ